MASKTRYIQAPVVFLHGTAGNPRQWRDLIGHLPQAIETLALDLPDYVAHDVRSAQRSLSQEAQALFPKLHGLEQPFHLVGHSYGGALALRIAMHWPGLVRSLTMFEPVMFHLLRDGQPGERQLHEDIAGLVSDLERAEEAGMSQTGVARFIDFWNGVGTFATYAPETQEKLTARMSLILANFAALQLESWPLTDCARIASPTLGVFGENSPPIIQHLTQVIVGQIPNAKMLSIRAAGHMLPVTHAGEVAKHLSVHILAAEAQALNPQHSAA